jgi:hypothetical protein
VQEPQVVAVNAELFSRDKQNVPMLLSLLEEPPTGIDDFHCRYHALQILTGLSSSLHRLQEVHSHDIQPFEGHLSILGFAMSTCASQSSKRM